MKRSLPLISVICGLAAVALPSSAAADTYCVAKPDCVAAGGIDKGSNVQDGLNAAQANAGPDRVEIGPGQYVGPFKYFDNGTSGQVEIVGSGKDQTHLTHQDPNFASALYVEGKGTSVVRDLNVVVPAISGARGLSLSRASASGVDITADPAATNVVGLLMDSAGSFSNGAVELPIDAAGNNEGIKLSSGSLDVHDASATAPTAIVSESQATVKRVRLKATVFGVRTSLGTTTVEDSLIDLRGANPAVSTIGLLASNGNNVAKSLTLDARHVTIVGNGAAKQVGALSASSATNAGQIANLELRDSVISNVAKPVSRQANNNGTANLVSDYSDHPTPGPALNVGAGTMTIDHHIEADPGFVDPAADDFRLKPDSPLVEAGDPAGLSGSESATDLLGNPRVADGNADCQARRDVGAFEHVPAALVVKVDGGTAAAGEPVSFTAAGSCDPDPGASLNYSWSFDDGGSATGESVQHAFSTAGQHTATVTVSSSGGRSGSAAKAVTVGPAVSSGPAAALDLGALAVKPARFHAAAGGPSIAKRGAAVSYELSAPATASFRVERAVAGRWHAGRCVRVTRSNRNARPCTRWVAVRGGFAQEGVKGTNRLRFSGRIGRRALKPGAYRLVAVARDTNGTASRQASARFRIVR
jgi:hypothetical protein